MTTILARNRSGSSVLRWPAPIYLAATALGVVMRLMQVGWDVPIAFDHLLHGHSHALYFGWAGLVILASGVSGQVPSGWLSVAAGLVPVMAAMFLLSGYSSLSIAISTILMLMWYRIIARWWRRTREVKASDVHAFRLGFLYVIGATGGIWVLAALQAWEAGGALGPALAVHAFLANFSWFFVFGAAALLLRDGIVEPVATRRVLWWWAALAWVTFPLGVAGGPEVPVLGPVARVASVLLVYPAWWWVRELWSSHRWVLRAAAFWFGIKTLSEVAVALGGSAVLTLAGRHGIVFYLHVSLLGYTTTVLALHLGWRASSTIDASLQVHQVGVAVMVAGLLMTAVTPWAVPGLWTAAAGAGLTWLAGVGWAIPVWRGLKEMGATERVAANKLGSS